MHHPPLLQMALALYVGNAMKDLLSAPRPLGLPYGRQKLLLLSGGSEEAELNAKVRRRCRGLRALQWEGTSCQRP